MTEFRPSRFEMIPLVIKNLLIINVLVFLAQNVINPSVFSVENAFALHSLQSPLFKPWQFLTHMFMHADLGHIFFNMFALWMFGSILENIWGPKRFLTFYILSGLGAAACHMIVLYFENRHMIQLYNAAQSSGNYADALFFVKKYGYAGAESISDVLYGRLNEATIGASGAVFGCLAAFGYLFPNTYIYIYFFLPLKAKWFVILYAAAELIWAVKGSAGDNVAHVAHLGGALVGFLLVYYWNKTNKRTFY